MPDWHYAVVSNCPTPAVYVEIRDGSNVFPLYLYPEEGVHTNQQRSLMTVHGWAVGKGGRSRTLGRTG